MKTSRPDAQIIDDFKPLTPKPTNSTNKPNLKDFDDTANWVQHPTNSSIELNISTGRIRTKDFSLKENYPKSI